MAVDPSISVTDSSRTTLASGTVVITNYASGDVLSFTNVPSTMGNIAGSYSSGTLSLSSSGGTATLGVGVASRARIGPVSVFLEHVGSVRGAAPLHSRSTTVEPLTT